MPLRKPEDQTLAHWLLDGLNAKTVVLLALGISGTYYALANRVTVIEQHSPTLAAQLEDLDRSRNNLLTSVQNLRASTISKDTYSGDQLRLDQRLADINRSLGIIEATLMQRPAAFNPQKF